MCFVMFCKLECGCCPSWGNLEPEREIEILTEIDGWTGGGGEKGRPSETMRERENERGGKRQEAKLRNRKRGIDSNLESDDTTRSEKVKRGRR